jgi:6-phosphogluconolactonase
VADEAARLVAARSEEAISQRGRFFIALSGGSTPRALYERLAGAPWRARIAWEHWRVFWGDERLVPPEDPRSNVGMAEQALLSKVPIPGTHVHRVPVDVDDRKAVARTYEEELRRAFALAEGVWPRFDVVLLGLGSDGHTASLFPHSPALEERQRLVVGTPPGRLPPPVDRVTLTLPVLNAARAIVFLVAGADKAPTLRRVLSGDQDLPAARVQSGDGELRWLVDAAAASTG